MKPGEATGEAGCQPEFRSGFVALVGRPNVGKSTLLNRMVGRKVSITSDRPSTTRWRIHGIRDLDHAQLVLVDTPGIHRPRGPLGRHLDLVATSSLEDADLVVMVVDASEPIGPGDRYIASRVPPDCIVALNKIDRLRPAQILQRLAQVSRLPFGSLWDPERPEPHAASPAHATSEPAHATSEPAHATSEPAHAASAAPEEVPVSARSGEGVDLLLSVIAKRLPPGPRFYPAGTVSDLDDDFVLAELVREQLLTFLGDELPQSIACRVVDAEPGYAKCEILVERPSQRRIVMGKNAKRLEEVARRVTRQLPVPTVLELRVRVEPDFRRRYSEVLGPY